MAKACPTACIRGELRDYSNRCIDMFSLPYMEDNGIQNVHKQANHSCGQLEQSPVIYDMSYDRSYDMSYDLGDLVTLPSCAMYVEQQRKVLPCTVEPYLCV